MLSLTNLGFTGTRDGMTDAQKAAVSEILGVENCVFHHGDCIGSDKQAHDIATCLGVYIHVWPPTSRALRAFCVGNAMHQPENYLVRNQHIVDNSAMLIATPKESVEKTLSGTWYTVRYAKSQHKPVCIILPNGDQVLTTGRKRA